MSRSTVRAAVLLAGVLAATAVLGWRPAPASAHPLGNFTVNQYAGLRVAPSHVDIDYLLDMAELPAFQERTREVDADRDGTVSAAERAGYATRACAGVAAAATLTVDGVPAKPAVTASAVRFPPGAGGLDTLRLECGLRVPVSLDREARLSYRGEAFAERVGWQEVTAIGDGTTLVHSSVPRTSPSRRLTAYPSDALSTPPRVRTATLVARPGGTAAGPVERPATALPARGVDRLTAAFTAFVGRPGLSLGLGLLALLLALALGAGHALAPGHGKTVMAAFLIGERGTRRQALALAGTVAAAHTVGVLVLGVVLATSLEFAPRRVYGWLGVASGVLLAAVGLGLLRRARRGHHHHDHDHDHDHDHGHDHDHDHDHDHGHHDHHHGPGHQHHHRRGPVIAMGLAGGLTPSPSAVVVLLGAVALGRAWFGVLLVAAYGLGMAATLTGIGLALARWRGRLERRLAGRRGSRALRLVPVLTSLVIVAVGLGVAASSALTLT